MALVQAWYQENGYNPETGLPTKETCERLNIAAVATTLAEDGPLKKWDGPLLMDLETYPKGGTRF
jgi:hypothetical protein